MRQHSGVLHLRQVHHLRHGVTQCKRGVNDLLVLTDRLAFLPFRYTLNYNSGQCEDDDECATGTHNCEQLGPGYLCINIQGSFRLCMLKK